MGLKVSTGGNSSGREESSYAHRRVSKIWSGDRAAERAGL